MLNRKTKLNIWMATFVDKKIMTMKIDIRNG